MRQAFYVRLEGGYYYSWVSGKSYRTQNLKEIEQAAIQAGYTRIVMHGQLYVLDKSEGRFKWSESRRGC